MTQEDNYEFHRERRELDQEEDERFKQGLTKSSMLKLQSYFLYEDRDSIDNQNVGKRFDEWFNDQSYHDLLDIINK